MKRLLISLLFTVLFAPAARADYRNQMSLLSVGGLSQENYLKFGKEWGYEWLVGDPWSPVKAVAAVDAGFNVSYNTNGQHGAKYYAFNNPGDATNPAEPTGVNLGNGHIPLTATLYQEFEKALCMTQAGASMATNDLYNPTTKTWKYRVYRIAKDTIIFSANFRSTVGINLNVAANMRQRQIHEEFAGKRLYTGIYFDEVRFPSTINPTCYNPINGQPGDPASYDAGRKVFIKNLISAFKSALGSAYGGTSGNPYRIDQYDPEQGEPGLFLDLVHNEGSGGGDCSNISQLEAGPATGCGTQNSATWGVVAKENAQVQLAPTNPTNTPKFFEGSCRGAQLIAGRAAWQKVWFGWFGQNYITNGNPCTHLLRAIPNWDNMVNATSRNWNESTDVYTSSNSYFDNNIAYSRHRLYNTNHRLYVVRHSGSPPITLNSNEKVVNAKCTNSLFFETSTCVSGYFSQSGTTVSLGGSVNNGDGYILTVHRQPSYLSAVVSAANQLDVCFDTDDAPKDMLPGTGSTGWTVTVAGVGKTPISTDRFDDNCFRLAFNSGTITSSAQPVTVALSSSNITSGTDMINGAGKVPAANFSAKTAQNNLSGGGGGTPITAQVAYQWQLINGTPDGAPLYGTPNTEIIPSPGGRARLVIKFRNTVNTQAPLRFPLYVAVDPGDTTDPSLGTPLSDNCANPVCYTEAPGVGDPTLTTELITGITGTNVMCRVITATTEVPLVTLPANTETECVYAIKFNESLTNGQKVYFYPRKNGTALLSSYTTTNLPHVTINTQRTELIGGTRTGGTHQ